MIAELGAFALTLALAFAIAQLGFSAAARARRSTVLAAAGEGAALIVAAEMVRERPAAAEPLRDHDLDAMPGEQAYGRLIDLGIEHRLNAACQQRHAHAALALRREGLRPVHRRGRRRVPGPRPNLPLPPVPTLRPRP